MVVYPPNMKNLVQYMRQIVFVGNFVLMVLVAHLTSAERLGSLNRRCRSSLSSGY